MQPARRAKPQKGEYFFEYHERFVNGAGAEEVRICTSPFWWASLETGELVRCVDVWDDFYLGDIVDGCRVVSGEQAWEIVAARKSDPNG